MGLNALMSYHTERCRTPSRLSRLSSCKKSIEDFYETTNQLLFSQQRNLNLCGEIDFFLYLISSPNWKLFRHKSSCSFYCTENHFSYHFLIVGGVCWLWALESWAVPGTRRSASAFFNRYLWHLGHLSFYIFLLYFMIMMMIYIFYYSFKRDIIFHFSLVWPYVHSTQLQRFLLRGRNDEKICLTMLSA